MMFSMALRAYDFSAVTTTGQTFYYNLLGGDSVEVTFPGPNYWDYYRGLPWVVTIPSNVSHNSATYRVVGISDYAFYLCSMSSIIIPNTVTSIGAHAFSCSDLTTITIPNSVNSIGSYAFSSCTSLTSVTISNSLDSLPYVFSNCTNLTSVSIPSSVTDLTATFRGCTSLTSVNIPSSVTNMDSTFYGCTSLTSINIPSSVTNMESTFHGCTSLTSVNIPSSVTNMESTFHGCTSLTSANIPSSVTNMALTFRGCTSLTSVNITSSVTDLTWTFYGCTSLTSVNIPSSVTNMNSTFYGCTSLTSVNIPSSVTDMYCTFYGCTSLTSANIPSSGTNMTATFSGCTGLTSVTIPASVTILGDMMFADCSSLTSVVIPNSVTTLGNGVFYRCSSLTSIVIPNSVSLIREGAFRGCTGLSSVSLSTSINAINEETFYGCSALTSISIPNSVTAIGARAFSYCRGLTTLWLSNSVDTIAGGAFYGCSSLTSLIIPASVEMIGNNAFNDCTGLSSITMLGTVPPTIGNQSIPAEPIIIIPCFSLNSYQSSWGTSYTFQEVLPQLDIALSVNNESAGDVGVVEGISCDSTYVISATANYGYHFTHWTGGVTDNPYPIKVQSDTVVTAFFERNEYTLSATANDESWGTITGSGTYLYMDTAIATAIPAPNHHLLYWQWGSETSSDNPRVFTMTEDVSAIAYFAIDTHHVAVTSSNLSMGSVEGGGEFEYGTPTTVSATPYSGYQFVRWSNGVTYNPYTFAVLTDMDLVAVFAEEGSIYNVTVTSSNPSQGSVSGGGPYAVGTEAVLTATAHEGFHFVQWNDGVADNPRTITVTQDTVLTDIFGANEGVEEAKQLQVMVYPNPTKGAVSVETEGLQEVVVMDMQGRVVVRSNSSQIELSAEPTGTYFLRIITDKGVVTRKIMLAR